MSPYTCSWRRPSRRRSGEADGSLRWPAARPIPCLARPDSSERNLAPARRNSLWLPVLAAILWFSRWASVAHGLPVEISVRIIERNQAMLGPRLLAPMNGAVTSFTGCIPASASSWTDAAIFMGRIGDDYICLMRGCERSAPIVDRWRFDIALLPPDWPLAQLLKSRPEWTDPIATRGDPEERPRFPGCNRKRADRIRGRFCKRDGTRMRPLSTSVHRSPGDEES